MTIIPDNHLHLLFYEELFLVRNDTDITAEDKKPDQSLEVENITEVKGTEQVIKETRHKEPDSRLLIISEQLSPSNSETLKKLLTAIDLNEQNTVIKEEWVDQPNHRKVIVFGYAAQLSKLPIHEIKYEKDKSILRTHTIDHLDQNKDDKVALWNVLKDWFQV
jgi:DNA polymerase III psi subunit